MTFISREREGEREREREREREKERKRQLIYDKIKYIPDCEILKGSVRSAVISADLHFDRILVRDCVTNTNI